MLRLGHFRPVHVKSKASQLLRTTLTARQNFTEHMVAIETTILISDAPELRIAIEPLLEVRNTMRKQKVLLDRQLGTIARKDAVCKLLMTIPGVGPIVSLAFKATIDDPSRFKDSKVLQRIWV